MFKAYLFVVIVTLNLALGAPAESRGLIKGIKNLPRNTKASCANLIASLDRRFLPQPREVPELINLFEGNHFRAVKDSSVEPEIVVTPADLVKVDGLLPDKVLTELGRYRLTHALLEDKDDGYFRLSLAAQEELRRNPELLVAVRVLLPELKVSGHWSLLPENSVKNVIEDLKTNSESRQSRMISLVRTPVSFIPPFWIFSALSATSGLKPLHTGRVLRQNIAFYKNVLLVADKLSGLLVGVQSAELIDIRETLAAAAFSGHENSLRPLALALDGAPKASPLRDWYYGRSTYSLRATFDAIAAQSGPLALLLGAVAQLDMDQALVGVDTLQVKRALRSL